MIKKLNSDSILLLIIGAQKAGTTTLFDFLSNIPGFCGSTRKEIGYFTKNIFFEKGQDWYFQHFSGCDDKSIKFEATPEYLYYPDAPQRISALGRQVKFIVLLRDPVARCYSAWNMFRVFNKSCANEIYTTFTQYANPPAREAIKHLLFTEKFPSFERAVEDDINRYQLNSDLLEPSFVRRGIYHEQILRFMRYFPLSDFLFMEQSELNNKDNVFSKISSFLGAEINSMDVSADLDLIRNVGMYDEALNLSSDVISELKEFYKPHNEKLFNLISRDFGWNSS